MKSMTSQFCLVKLPKLYAVGELCKGLTEITKKIMRAFQEYQNRENQMSIEGVIDV